MQPDFGFNLRSRVHPLKTYIRPSGERRVFVKRDDELSSGITGSKYRKFASLIPHLVEGGYDEVLLIGSSQSNNVTGLLQLLIENRLPYRLMLLRANEDKLRGNRQWIHLLNGGDDRTEWVTREDWPQVYARADDYAKAEGGDGRKVFIVREGAAIPESLPGAMSLANDILRNEQQAGCDFQHIFIDSGTGMAAIGLLCGLAKENIRDKAVHITLIAGSEEEFRARYSAMNKVTDLAPYEGQILFYRPAISPSFGSITSAVLAEIKSIAFQEGILVEPVYTAKHFYTAKTLIESQHISGDSLLINCGGAFGLTGFGEMLAARQS